MTDHDRVALTLLLAIALMALVFWVRLPQRLGSTFLGPKQWRDIQAWEERIELLLVEHTKTVLRTASIETELASLVKSMPAEFIHPIQRGVRFGYAYDVAMKRKAFELGILDATELEELLAVKP